MKVWLITAAVVLGFFQLLTAAHIYQLLRFSPPGRLYNLVHRFSGYTAVALTAPAPYHCIFLLGFGTEEHKALLALAESVTGVREVSDEMIPSY